MLDQRTRDKIAICGGKKDYLPKLLKHLELADIPDFLGGEDTTCDFAVEKGVWAGSLSELPAFATEARA